MTSAACPVTIDQIQSRILVVEGVQVMLDHDLAELYGVEVRRLNEQVSRNIERFPVRFMRQLTQEEFTNLKSQIATSSLDGGACADLKSQIATSRWGGVRKPPRVFTEQGISMLSAVLRSPTAIDVSIRIMDAFVAMRKFFHDRFLIVDDKKLYLFGASLKDLGLKCFAFTELDAAAIPELKRRV